MRRTAARGRGRDINPKRIPHRRRRAARAGGRRRRTSRWPPHAGPATAPRRRLRPDRTPSRPRCRPPRRECARQGHLHRSARSASTEVATNREAAGASARTMPSTSLSFMTASTIGSGAVLLARRYSASASAPAGLCAASSSSSPRGSRRSHSRRAGHDTSVRPRTMSSPVTPSPAASPASSTRTATTALPIWCAPLSPSRTAS